MKPGRLVCASRPGTPWSDPRVTSLEPDGSPFPVTYSAAELSSLVATRSHRSATSSPAATGTVAGSVS